MKLLSVRSCCLMRARKWWVSSTLEISLARSASASWARVRLCIARRILEFRFTVTLYHSLFLGFWFCLVFFCGVLVWFFLCCLGFVFLFGCWCCFVVWGWVFGVF